MIVCVRAIRKLILSPRSLPAAAQLSDRKAATHTYVVTKADDSAMGYAAERAAGPHHFNADTADTFAAGEWGGRLTVQHAC